MSLPFFVITLTGHQFSRYYTCLPFYITMDKLSICLLKPMFIFLFETRNILCCSFWLSSVQWKLVFVWFLCIKCLLTPTPLILTHSFSSDTLLGQTVPIIQMHHCLTIFSPLTQIYFLERDVHANEKAEKILFFKLAFLYTKCCMIYVDRSIFIKKY